MAEATASSAIGNSGQQRIEPAPALWAVLGTIADRRGRKGRQYPLQALLAVAIAAMLAGANDLRAIFRWGRRLTPEALAQFGLTKAPCHSQWFYFFRSLDADALSATLGEFALGRAGGNHAEPGHIAIDGKTLKGSRRLDARALHVVSAFSTKVSAVVRDVVLEPDQNEITAALILLKQLPLNGVIITGDAIFCQREICRTITDGGGDYAFVVKDNQPELKAAIAESFGELSPPQIPRHKSRPSCRLTRGPLRQRSKKATAASKRGALSPAPRSCRISSGRARRKLPASGANGGSATRSRPRPPTS